MVDVLRKSPFDKFPAVYRNIYVQSVVCSIQSNMTDEDIYSCPLYFCWKTEMIRKVSLTNLFWYDIYQANAFYIFAFSITERKFNIQILADA